MGHRGENCVPRKTQNSGMSTEKVQVKDQQAWRMRQPTSQPRYPWSNGYYKKAQLMQRERATAVYV